MSGIDENNLPDYESGDHVAKQAMIAFTIVAAIVALVVGAYLIATRDAKSDDTATGEITTTPEATPSAKTKAPSPCPEPKATPNQKPKQFEKAPGKDKAPKAGTTATIGTSCGDITVELFGDKAPLAAANFAFLAQEKFYDNSLCHRLVTQGIYVLQCGDPTTTGSGSPGYKFGPVENAPKDNIYEPGTLAMARVGNDGNSNGAQFFIVYDKSQIPSDTAGGYTVFGKVTKGLDIVKKIAEGGTDNSGVAPAWKIAITGVTIND